MRVIVPGWNGSQRGVLIAFVLIMLIVLGVRAWRHSEYVSDPQPERPKRFDELADKIDPNTADWQALAALPQLGEKRAKVIIEYRDRYVSEHPGSRAFSRAEDLMDVRGIGRVMMQSLEPYFIFPTTQPAPTTQP